MYQPPKTEAGNEELKVVKTVLQNAQQNKVGNWFNDVKINDILSPSPQPPTKYDLEG